MTSCHGGETRALDNPALGEIARRHGKSPAP